MKKEGILIIGSMLVATLFGIFGQSISYFMHDLVNNINPLYCLTAITVSSLFLYVATPILTFIFARKLFGLSLFIAGMLGIPISLFSLFVLAMWWG